MRIKKYSLVTLGLVSGLMLRSPIVTGVEISSQGHVDFQYGDEAQTNGPLRIEGVSVIHFGSQPLKGDTIVAQAIYTPTEVNHQGQYVPLHIETIDDRGTNTGWSLQVKQSQEFTEQPEESVTLADLSVLTGAELTLSATESYDESTISELGKSKPSNLGQKVRLNANFQKIVEAKVDEGIGSWGTYFGDLVDEATTGTASNTGESKRVENQAITLKIPGQVAKKADVNYQAQLTWVLVATPEI
ncbi:WxL domain-containing protein [Vagococcus salmoninarum]|uniref:WxL domain-containing protein n=1 Tax=Vagococcus salmoninarum TaxID=2739 RepID=UPI0018821607|nr:WxL domain-containing protein [Vagococcus salmoninarum]MBE9388217.1 WxL domain-containing protein [Vagococcus salmoninarum]